ncbi:MAG: aconitate hydratase AcnA [Deltaproteobacteria bacterium]|nr:aconitate hydratase AcnA [Deltaproteobacteria bacterium]
MTTSKNSFSTQTQLQVSKNNYEIFSLKKLQEKYPQISKLPISLKILLENLLRFEDDRSVSAKDIEAIIHWEAKATPSKEIAYRPARVLLQDFTGVPAVVDLAAMREAIIKLGGDPKKINPLQQMDLVIDHSVQVDFFGTADAAQKNAQLEFERNIERYRFLKWGQKAFANFKVVPPDTGIVHQVNLEHIASVVYVLEGARRAGEGVMQAYPDTLVGTDSHTTMINGLGVVGWGVGGIEAEAAMLGQPISMLIPQVVGFKMKGKLPEGATATDLVLTVTQMLRKKGVVGKFVEFYGDGLSHLSLADRATVANMAPEYGATIGFFPIDEETLNYLKLTGRGAQNDLVRAYAQEQGLWRNEKEEAVFSDTLELDLATVLPSIAGPKRPQDRILLSEAKKNFTGSIKEFVRDEGQISKRVKVENRDYEIEQGAVVLTAITSCTNTSNPSVLIAAGLLAKKAVEKGLKVKPWVKTSLAPGSLVVADYLKKAGLLTYLEQLKFNIVGYGCTTCIGNSGPIIPEVAQVVEKDDLVVSAVLSGNRNFEGRINPHVKMNYLASPPLVVAYALAGRMNFDPYNEALAKNDKGQDVFLKDIWPSTAEVQSATAEALSGDMFEKSYSDVFKGDANWQSISVSGGETYSWDAKSTYIKHPPYFEGMTKTPVPVTDIQNARILALLGDSVTTDHISPAGSIKASAPAGKYLQELGVKPVDFNSYGARRGNHEVMVRGTFANIRIKNQMLNGVEGGLTLHLPEGEQMSIYDAAMKYQNEKVGLVVLAGKEYGTGSSRDWAAKGTRLLGVRAVIAESFERIHRSNLVGMGVLPLQFKDGQSWKSLGLSGKEQITLNGIASGLKPLQDLIVKADDKSFTVTLRIDTPDEVEYYKHGGILPYVLRQLV